MELRQCFNLCQQLKVDDKFLELINSEDPFVEERLAAKKKEVIEVATIVKEPVKESKQMDVFLTQEELVLNRKPVTKPIRSYEKPVKTRTEIKIPLKREEIESTKKSYVREEVIVKKKPVTETQTVTEEVASEKITEG